MLMKLTPGLPFLTILAEFDNNKEMTDLQGFHVIQNVRHN